MTNDELDALWRTWIAGETRCPYCVDMCPATWFGTCDCCMAEELLGDGPIGLCDPTSCDDCRAMHALATDDAGFATVDLPGAIWSKRQTEDTW